MGWTLRKMWFWIIKTRVRDDGKNEGETEI